MLLFLSAELNAESLATRHRERMKHSRARLSLMGGAANLKLDERLNTSGYRVNHTYTLGGSAEGHSKYFGAEVEGFYGSAGVTPTVNRSTYVQAREVSMSAFGIAGDIHAEHLFSLGPVFLRPKAGAGYGLASLTVEGDLTFLGNVNGVGSAKEVLHGPFGIVGLTLIPLSWLEVSSDYLHSFATTLSLQGAFNQFAVQMPNSGANFSRLRVGAMFRPFSGVLLGPQFVQRQISVTFPLNLDSGLLSPKQQFFQGVVAFEL